MKASEIQVGSHYKAKVSGNIVTVRVDSIGSRTAYGGRDGYSGRSKLVQKACYEVTNLVTGRKTTFRSAAKFRAAVPMGKSGKPLPMAVPKIDKEGNEYFEGSNII